MVRVFLAGYTGELGRVSSDEYQHQPFPRRVPFADIVFAGPFHAEDEGDPVIAARNRLDQLTSADVVLVQPGAEFECGVAVGLGKRVVLDIPSDSDPLLIRSVIARTSNLYSALEAVKPWMIHAPTSEREYRSYYACVGICR